jgi:opacity protein-like surface antigen
MDVMNKKLACLACGALLAATAGAEAQTLGYGGGLKDHVAVPAPIPVPAPVPIPEGFTYYLRADIGFGWVADVPGFTETGNLFGTAPGSFAAAAPFTSTGAPFGPRSNNIDDVVTGTLGFGAYFSPRLRGDLTLDFRNDQNFESTSSYSYTSATAPGGTVTGTVREQIKINSVVGLANLYLDILPRGAFSPYVGAGIGFVYNDMERQHVNTETPVPGAAAGTFTAVAKNKEAVLAAALMGGVTFAFDHRWAIDVNYRALFLDGGSVSLVPSGQTSRIELEEHWEHQVRVGLRYNIW